MKDPRGMLKLSAANASQEARVTKAVMNSKACSTVVFISTVTSLRAGFQHCCGSVLKPRHIKKYPVSVRGTVA